MKFIRRLPRLLYEQLNSIRWRLLATYMLISLAPLFFIANSISSRTEEFFVVSAQRDLKNFANRVAGQVSRVEYFTDDSMLAYLDTTIRSYSKEMNVRVIVVDARAVVLVDTGAGAPDVGKLFAVPEIIDALGKKSVAGLAGENSIAAAAAVLDDGGGVVGAVYTLASIQAERERLLEIRAELLRTALFVAAAVLALALVVAQWFVRPLRQARDVVRKMTEGHLNQRIGVRGNDEFAQLAEAFNNMSERLESIDSARQEFVSNVSHELKTPLTSIKVLSESLLFQDGVDEATYKEFMHDINQEVNRMTDIVNELLVLVRMDQIEHPLNITTIRLNKLVMDIVKRLSPIAGRKHIQLTIDSSKQVTLDGDEIKLTLAISNLIENGIKYTPEGGKVSTTIDSDHQNAFITVTDNGIGIAEEDQAKVFSRFYRVDKTRDRQTGGTGLGLSITHKTVLLHNGSIKLTSKEDFGTTFTVRIPLRRIAELPVKTV